MRFLPLLVLLTACHSGAADTLRVMSFNVRYPNPGDGENRWEARRELLVRTIREQRPDVIGTQELFHSQGEYIVSQLPEYAWFGVSRRGNQQDEHMGVFYRKDALRLVESGNFWLSETPDTAGSISWNMSLPRMVTWGLFETAGSNTRFYFYNTHFAHRDEDEPARVESAKVIATRLAALPADSTVVLTGDFNSGTASEPYRILTAKLQDARKGVKDQAGEIGTFHGFSGKPQAERIDWILYRGRLRPQSFATITTNDSGRYPSDHFPVVAVFERR